MPLRITGNCNPHSVQPFYVTIWTHTIFCHLSACSESLHNEPVCLHFVFQLIYLCRVLWYTTILNMWKIQIYMKTWAKLENFLNGKIRAAPLAAATHICTSSELLPLLYPQTKVGDILDSGPSRRRRHRRRNFLVDAITQKQINIFFSNLVHMLRVPKGRSLF